MIGEMTEAARIVSCTVPSKSSAGKPGLRRRQYRVQSLSTVYVVSAATVSRFSARADDKDEKHET